MSTQGRDWFMLIPPCSMVSKILRSKHKYLDQDFGREPPPIDRAQSKISKPLVQLDESAPWSSWSEITAAGSYAMGVPRSPASSNEQRQGSQGYAVDNNAYSMQTSAAWTSDFSGMSIPKLDRTMSDVYDVYQDELYNPVLPLARIPQDPYFHDLPISSPMSSPFVPAHVPSPPPIFDTHSEQYPIVQQARQQENSIRGTFDAAIERALTRLNNSGSHRAPSPSDRREASSPKPEQDFWTGRRQSHRPSSVQSYGSSRNSSLHGSPVMDQSYQSPVLFPEDQKHGSTEAGHSPRGLFPAPIDWTATPSRDQVTKIFSFDCEICGEVVKASRRLDWQ